MKKLFFGIEMTWKKVIKFALITGTLTAIVSMVPFLVRSSFNDLAVYLDAWILFALVIIMNCKDAKEAMKKTFVFFLISQPLVYLIQAIFTSEGFSIFRFYPYWAAITVLTIPGAFIAYQIKKQNILSVLILSVANCLLAYMIAYYISMMKISFPKHLFSSIFCLFLIVLFILSLLDKKKHRIIAAIIALLAFIIFAISLDVFKKEGTLEIELGEGNWDYRFEGEEIVSVEINEEKANLTSKDNGDTFIFFTNEKKDEQEYAVTVSGTNIFASLIEKEEEKPKDVDKPTEKKDNKEEKEEKTVREEKTMYTYQTVEKWDEENVLLEAPKGDYEERIQYGTSVATFENNSFSLSKPNDDFYKEAIQYGYNQRTKQAIKVPYTVEEHVGYNNVGGCPAGCINANSYVNEEGLDACECTIIETHTEYKDSFSYGPWQTNNSSWRFDSAYTESDIIAPITRNVYLIPTSWNDPTDWSFDNKKATNEAKVVERKVYLVPAVYSAESVPQETIPNGHHYKINAYQYYRIITNGVPGEWIKVESN